MEDVAAAKQRAGHAAANTVDDGSVVGLGTGSTTAYAIEELGRRVDAGLDIQGVPTSYQSRSLATEVGIPLTDIGDQSRIDVAIDGADQLMDTTAIKGGGAAHTQEKIVAAAADRFVVVVDERKCTDQLDHPVPLAVVPAARTTVIPTLEALGGNPTLRAAQRKDGPVITDEGHLVIDCDFGVIDAPGELAAALAELPGIVEHGLFVGMADEHYVGSPDAVTVQQL